MRSRVIKFLSFKLKLFIFSHNQIKNALVNLLAEELKKRGALESSDLKEKIQNLPFGDERVEALSPKEIAELADWVYLLIKGRSDYQKK